MLKKMAVGALAFAVLGGSAARAMDVTVSKDIVDTAIAAGSFKTLTRALEAADLVERLKGNGPYTVFAPTDAAFARLPAGTLERLLKPENKMQLQRILTYHVVSGKVMSADVAKLQSATAVSGDTIAIAANSNGVMVDRAQVVQADIAATNGIIHVIDQVILPAEK